MLSAFTFSCAAVSLMDAAPPNFTSTFWLPVEYGRIFWMSAAGAMP